MNCKEEYSAKLCTPEEAVKCVKSGDWVDYITGTAFPASLDAALAERRNELENVKIRGNMIAGPIMVVEKDPDMEHFVYNSWHCSAYERKLWQEGRIFFTPMSYRNIGWYYSEHLKVDVAMISVSPMDKHGYFSFGCAVGMAWAVLSQAGKIILEVNEAIPRVHGIYHNAIHISQVDAVVECGWRELKEGKQLPIGETDEAIAENVLPYIEDGSTLQIGVGNVPNALGKLIARSDLRDLGMHTELCGNGFLELFKAGKLTNSRKNLLPGRGVTGFIIGTRELYDWVDDNPFILGAPIGYVNDPAVISQNDKVVSINACLNVDLYGQVSAESAGTRHISGSGGQLDFVEGAIRSKGGKSFLCMSSTYTDKEGALHSRILPRFEGDIITTPRSQAYYIVTEYGAVNLAGMNTWQRAEALISIAHPAFREELIRAAERQKIWLPSEKR